MKNIARAGVFWTALALPASGADYSFLCLEEERAYDRAFLEYKSATQDKERGPSAIPLPSRYDDIRRVEADPERYIKEIKTAVRTLFEAIEDERTLARTVYFAGWTVIHCNRELLSKALQNSK